MNTLAGPINELSISRPTLILDRTRVLRNIEKMAARAAQGRVEFRPHFKTHQSIEIGSWFRGRGVEAITVSSVTMARYFAESGWKDITIAFPVNIREIPEMKELAGKTDLKVLLDSEAAATALANALDTPVQVWIKIDTGYGRAGLPWDETDQIASLIRTIARTPRLSFHGILTHEGRTYAESSAEGIRRRENESIARLAHVKNELAGKGIGPCRVSLGDTPGCSLLDDFSGVDEIRPGNFVFHDLMQAALGSCRDTDIAVALACPVVGKYMRRNEIVIYGGAIHLSKESLHDPSGRTLFGCLAAADKNSLGHALFDAPVASLSQEHGVVRLPDRLLASIRIGDVVPVFPVHSSLTCNLHREYITLEGERISRL